MSKANKDSQRRQKLADRHRRQKALGKRHEFPRFTYEPNEADPAFVELVREAAKTIDFRDATAFHPAEAAFYKRVKEVGGWKARAEFAAAIAGRPDAGAQQGYLDLNLGRTVLGRIPTPDLLKYLTANHALFSFSGNDIHVIFRSLKRTRGPGGTVYYSRHEPKVTVGNQTLTVAFSGHALERAGPRLAYEWPGYPASGDVFAFFDQCLQFEVCELYGGHLAFTFWEHCAPGFLNYRLAEEVMGERFVPGADYCFRVGYCPAVIEGRFLKAKTLLFPGYASTPEYTAVLKAGLPHARRREVLEQAKGLTMHRVMDGMMQGVQSEHNLVRWFHDLGVEQVRQASVAYAEAL
ncbi:hypothetical protein J0H58_20290 [bacterium]|nr:hypothetical protein [bacterium]